MAMKICKECGSEVSSQGVCQKCGKDQRNFFMKHKVITFILIVIIFGMVAGITGGSGNTSKTTLTSSNTVNEDKTSVAKKYNVGEIYEDNSLAVRYVSVNDNFTGYSKYADVKSGYKIIKAEFEFENLSSTDQYVSVYEFNCYADGYDCENFWSTDDSGFSSTLSSGKKTKGSVYFQVPKDATAITIEYTLNSFTSDKVEFVVK